MPAPERSRAEAERAALGVLGLARRGGHAVVGTRAVRDAARAGRLRALVLARDATENARRRLADSAARAGVPVMEAADRRRLGVAVGRPRVVAVGLTDRGLAEALTRRLGGGETAARGETGEAR